MAKAEHDVAVAQRAVLRVADGKKKEAEKKLKTARDSLTKASAAAEAIRACPFYTSMEMTAKADLIVGDYNYVFDPVASLGHLFDGKSARDFVLRTGMSAASSA